MPEDLLQNMHEVHAVLTAVDRQPSTPNFDGPLEEDAVEAQAAEQQRVSYEPQAGRVPKNARPFH